MAKTRCGVALAVPTLWSASVNEWTIHLRAAGRSPETIRTRLAHITQYARDHADRAPTEVTEASLVVWAGRQDWTAATRRSFRTSARQFFGWQQATGRASSNPADGLPPIRQTPPRPRPAPESAYSTGLEVAAGRDRLILRLMGEIGLRRGEVARIHTRDVVEELHGGHSLVVHGKGGKERLVPLTAALTAAIRAGAAGHTPGASPTGWLFPGAVDGHISPGWIGKLASRALPGDYTGHQLRHRFATCAYAHDRDIVVVQQLLGHASPETTQRYVRVPDDALRATALAVAARAA